jgi:PAS domain S-box-containing protein
MNDLEEIISTQAELAASSRGLVEQGVFEAAVHKTRMGMALADPNLPDCPLVYVNPAFTALTGYEPEDALRRNCRFLQGPDTDPASVRRIREAIANRTSIQEEIYNYRRDGQGFWNALYISPVFDDEGTLTYYFASHIDISARREAVRRQAQRMESMGALASGVAHEFNNLLTVVLGSLERAALRAVDEGQRKHLDRASWGARRAGELAGELLSLSRRQTSEDRIMDLNQLLRGFEDTLTQVAPGGVRLRLDLAAEPLPVRVDHAKLELVLLNLLRNAADAMPKGGEVTVSTRVLPAADARSVLDRTEAVELAVSDNGEGMPPEVAERATDLFFTTKAPGKGTGLGLFLVLEFMDKSGGRLKIDSQAGLGTRVRMVLPREGIAARE